MERDGEFLEVTLSAGGFCRQLVRRFVGAIATVGRGEADLAWVERVLSDERLQGPAGVAPAPPYPLVLTGVDYPDVSFAPDSDALGSARDLFASRRIEYATRAQVFDLIAGQLGV
jgi:tRNA pseudouridine38-40 synthase